MLSATITISMTIQYTWPRPLRNSRSSVSLCTSAALVNFHRSVAVVIIFQLHKFFGNDGHSPSTVLWKHGALGRSSGNANAQGSAVPSATSKEPQLQPHLLLKHTEMLRRLHELQPNLADQEAPRLAPG